MIFKFPINADFLKLVIHTKQCKEHIPTFSQMFEGRYRKDGRDISLNHNICPTGEDVDLTKVPAALELVKDGGVYLMSNGSPNDIVSGDTSRTVYAEGFGPNVHVGGDDYVECIPLDWVIPAIERRHAFFYLSVTEESISPIYPESTPSNN